MTARKAARLLALASVLGASMVAPRGVAAQSEGREVDPVLARYLEALGERRLLARETGSIEALRQAVRAGEQLYFDGRYDEAALILYEVAESPRFSDFAGLDEFREAELTLAGALAELGALRTASRYLLRILGDGPESPYFGPAYRRFVDVALERADLAAAIAALEGLGIAEESLPEDAANELRYLRARAHYDAGELAEAEALLDSITRRSRFHANALYLKGVIQARRGELEQAESSFCSIATMDDREAYTFFVDQRYFEVKDLAWLALGRVAHEGLRSDHAFYYYFQVPNDSERVAEALFEAAYAMYEGGDNETAVDLLDQLEARFPRTAFAHEAALLRGYVHLGRCEFDLANRHFRAYLSRFEPVLEEIDRILGSPARQARLHDQLLSIEERSAREGQTEEEEGAVEGEELATGELLLSLLRVDPTFYRLHADIRTLDAEAARAGRLSVDLAALASRLRGEDAPTAADEAQAYPSEVAELRMRIRRARDLLNGLHGQLDRLRSGGAPQEEVRALEDALRGHANRIRSLDRELSRQARSSGEAGAEGEESEAPDVAAMLRRDARRARRLPARVGAVREQLTEGANRAAVAGLRDLRDTLAAHVRRARIGRVDAVMGSKRRIEIQIESLAAGRFPPELVDPLRIQGLLREDEEYWPFEGELWTDEFVEAEAEETP